MVRLQGADPGRILWDYEGVEDCNLGASGQLRIGTGEGTLTDTTLSPSN